MIMLPVSRRIKESEAAAVTPHMPFIYQEQQKMPPSRLSTTYGIRGPHIASLHLQSSHDITITITKKKQLHKPWSSTPTISTETPSKGATAKAKSLSVDVTYRVPPKKRRCDHTRPTLMQRLHQHARSYPTTSARTAMGNVTNYPAPPNLRLYGQSSTTLYLPLRSSPRHICPTFELDKDGGSERQGRGSEGPCWVCAALWGTVSPS